MKKLMITAAAAALTTGAFAGVAQVYDMTINVKTTECKDGKKLITDKCGNSYRYYRTQTSYKFEGKFWGCGCATIAAPIAEQYGRPRLDNGLLASEMTCEDNNNSYMFWGKKAAFHHTDFAWPLLQLVGKNGDNVEGYFTAEFFGCEDGELVEDASLALQGAGYGSANINDCQVDEETLSSDYDHAFNYIKSMSGSVVGIYNVADLAGMVGCVYCGDYVECKPFEFCNCVELRDKESAAYGTFSLKYNSSLTSKVNNNKYIDEAYKFPKFVTEEFECIEEGAEPPETTECDKAKANVAAIEKEIKGYQDAITDALAAYYATTTAVEKAKADYVNPQQSALWIAGTNDTDNALKAYLKEKATFKAMCEMNVYKDISTNAAVVAAGTQYWEDAQTYLKAAARLDAGLDTNTNAVNILKAKVANDYLALENAIAKVAAGETTKATLKAKLQDCYDAAKVYFDTAVKYVYLYTYPEALKDMPDYGTVSQWTKNQLKAVYDELKADQNKKSKAVTDAQTAWNNNSVRLNAELGTAQAYQKTVCD